MTLGARIFEWHTSISSLFLIADEQSTHEPGHLLDSAKGHKRNKLSLLKGSRCSRSYAAARVEVCNYVFSPECIQLATRRFMTQLNRVVLKRLVLFEMRYGTEAFLFLIQNLDYFVVDD